MVYHNLESELENETHKLLRAFEIQTDHLISTRRPDLTIINKKKKKENLQDCADHRVKLKESEMKDKYQDLTMESKKPWNVKVMIIPIVIGALGTVTKGLMQGLEDLEIWGRVETIQNATLLRSARILRRVLETWGDLLSLSTPVRNHQLHWREKPFHNKSSPATRNHVYQYLSSNRYIYLHV